MCIKKGNDANFYEAYVFKLYEGFFRAPSWTLLHSIGWPSHDRNSIMPQHSRNLEREGQFSQLCSPFSVPKVENEHEHEIEKCIAALAIIAVRPVATRRGRRRRATKKERKRAVFITVCLSAATEFENEFSRLLKNIWILLSVRILGLSCSN